MKYLETEHEKKSFAITTAIMAVLLLLCIFLGLTYMDPPPENGIAINFGNTDAGSGNTNTTEPVKSEPREVNEQPVEESTSEPTTPSKASENVITADNEAAIALKKQKEIADAKAKAEAIAKAAEEKKKKEEADKKAKLDALIGGVKKSEGKTTGGDGTSTTPGNQGKIDGSIYSNSYYGSGKGVGTGNGSWGLNGRRLSSPGAVKADCNDEGTIVVEVKVNKNGGVTNAKYSPSGSNTTSTCLKEAAIKSAYKYKWNNDENAPDTQIGFIVFNFSNGE
ncbi:energy transducer TonB [Flavobacterium piscinae]|uniref:Energy transducer TonB n=1 Tax=Flavobacterium piscinae TaxID=2506424 RepID=A0A4Q1KWT1_9FLAO|nr:energy transducer TonB [Flavobacterium piscinae]RXR34768.1 energy transducer TonB [Flavobacterium piscinae]